MKDGPYFHGNELSYVDIMIAPWFLRFFQLKEYRQFDPVEHLSSEALRNRTRAWMDAVQSEVSIKPTIADKARMLDRYNPKYRDV